MRIDLVFPVLPPALDGIGDHTAHLASALADEAHDVRVLTAQSQPDPIPGVQVRKAFNATPRRGIRGLLDAVVPAAPDWLVLQYNPFSYGRWGLNLSLPATLQAIRHQCPNTNIALMVHEPFVPVENWRFALFTTWQRWQLWRLGQTADVVFVSIAPWVDRFQSWFSNTPVLHLPVGSNIPHVTTDRATVRNTLGLPPDAFVVGLFGSGHASRLLPFVRHAVDRLRRAGVQPAILYVGPAGAKVEATLGPDALYKAGALPGPEVSRHFAAMDLYLAPFRKGVSTRRGSFLVGLQHGIATVSTEGSQTDPLLREHHEASFLLAPDTDAHAFGSHVETVAQDKAYRTELARSGQALFASTFAWPRIARSMLTALTDRMAPDAAPDRAVPAPSG
ncbi:MAG: glycosyltransferase family 4 protein [Salinibacter sp.]